MIILAENKIGEVPVVLTVEETIGSRLGGMPVLHIGKCPIDNIMVEEVDTLQVIKAIASAKDVEDFADKIDGIWREEEVITSLKSSALEEIDTDDFFKVLCEADEFDKRMINATSQRLRATEPNSTKWFKLRAIMYDRVRGALDEL